MNVTFDSTCTQGYARIACFIVPPNRHKNRYKMVCNANSYSDLKIVSLGHCPRPMSLGQICKVNFQVIIMLFISSYYLYLLYEGSSITQPIGFPPYTTYRGIFPAEKL